MSRIIGIDYSMTCPAICILGKDFDSSEFMYVTTRKSHVGKMRSNIIGTEMPTWKNNINRFDIISDFIINFIKPRKDDLIVIEGYALGSTKGMIFNIAEHTGILKYKLQDFHIETPPPTTVKKFATDKGNAKKELMFEHFVKDTAIDLTLDFPSKSTKINSPINDIVDSWYMAKYGEANYV